MSYIDFGKQLRKFRQQCIDPLTGKTLSQQRLGELLGREFGATSFSGAAVSDWERGESRIHMDNRLVLISLLKVLNKTGGLKTLLDANNLLESGNYRTLNPGEQVQLFPEASQETTDIQSPKTNLEKQIPFFNFLLSSFFSNSPEEIEKIFNKANEGPPPAWPRIAVVLTKRVTDHWSVFHILRVLIWVWVWLLTYLLIAPSLQWPFDTRENVLQVMVLYASGTIILPLFIGILVNTKDQAFWKEKKISNNLPIRLYIHQGSYIGFHLGYFIIFPLAVIKNQFGLQSTTWVEFVKMIIPIAIGYAGAQLVPYNLWLAYKRLHPKDGAVFFIFVLLGPAWAWFFLEFNKGIGIFTLLAAITLLAGAMTLQYRRKKNTTIPILWWVIFYGLVLICQIALVLIQ